MAKKKTDTSTKTPRRGTHYTERTDRTQISFRASPELKAAFYASVIGTREQSLRAAVVLWLGLADYPEIRAKAISLQKMKPKAAAKEMKAVLETMVPDRVMTKLVRDLPATEKQKILAESKKGT